MERWGHSKGARPSSAPGALSPLSVFPCHVPRTQHCSRALSLRAAVPAQANSVCPQGPAPALSPGHSPLVTCKIATSWRTPGTETCAQPGPATTWQGPLGYRASGQDPQPRTPWASGSSSLQETAKKSSVTPGQLRLHPTLLPSKGPRWMPKVPTQCWVLGMLGPWGAGTGSGGQCRAGCCFLESRKGLAFLAMPASWYARYVPAPARQAQQGRDAPLWLGCLETALLERGGERGGVGVEMGPHIPHSADDNSLAGSG